ncbi:hypothetical protein F4808DRAFT_315055 [Astrocystis sublimbata]|nr:hypothetical protein F4808DRAFT_315055 [Astrocystis sublimbata]
MRMQAVLALPLVALPMSSALPAQDSARRSMSPAICRRSEGLYDICDTDHSYVRCRGHEAVLIADCKIAANTFCQVVNGRGSCDAQSPPSLADDGPSCEANPSGSGGSSRGRWKYSVTRARMMGS